MLQTQVHRKRTVNFLSKEVISKIKSAETAAATVRANAQVKAQEMTAEAEKRGKSLCETTERNTSAELKAMLEQIRTKSDELLEKSRADAQKDARAVEMSAKLHMNMAVKLIVWGIIEKCQ